MQNTAMVLKFEIFEFQDRERNKQISNHWPDSVDTNININGIENVDK